MAPCAAALIAWLKHKPSALGAVTLKLGALPRRERLKRFHQGGDIVSVLIQSVIKTLHLRRRKQHALLELAAAIGGLHRAKRAKLDPDARLPNAHGRPRDAHHAIAHERFIDRADLLDIERAIAKALPLKDDEPIEHAVKCPIVNARRVHLGAALGEVDGHRLAREAALQKREGVRIKELPAARREPQIAMRDAEVDGAKEREQATIGAKAVVHRLGMRALILAEALIEPEHAEMLRIERMIDRQKPLILGVEQKDEPKDHAQHALVDVLLIVRERLPQPIRPIARRVALGGALKALEEDLDRLKDLLGERLRDIRLAPAALMKEPLERIFKRGAVGALGAKQQLERGEDRPPRGLKQLGKAKGEVPARFALRRKDKAQLAAVGEEPDGDLALPEEPLELRRRRIAPAPRLGLGLIEREMRRAIAPRVIAQIPNERKDIFA